MVGTNNKSEISVSVADSAREIFEEYGLELWFMFFMGILLGIILTCCFFYIKFFSKKTPKKDNKEE